MEIARFYATMINSQARNPAEAKKNMIKRDLHVHLHGCLSAEDLWHQGKDIYKNQDKLLHWYAEEYQKAWGRLPDYRQYWESTNGIELLKNDYIFAEANNFARFQACFNLIVALCPMSPNSFKVEERIIRKVAKQGLEYFQARTLIPIRFNNKEVELFLCELCKKVQELNSELPMQTSLVFCLFRENSLAQKQYQQLRDFIKAYPDLGSNISGIDFAFNEEGAPPKEKVSLFKKFHQDNQTLQKLEILYHVGESFTDKSLNSAIRWVWEANALGATRLGHAIALGVDPKNYAGRRIQELKTERLDTINWLINHHGRLKEHGYHSNLKDLRKEIPFINKWEADTIPVEADKTSIEDSRALQVAVAGVLKEEKAFIETCPTSNLRIGQITQPIFHPLKFFHEQGLNYTVCTDDPGIFNIDWTTEYEFSQQISKLAESKLKN